jgi:Zn-finger nucleic acid-binding protein
MGTMLYCPVCKAEIVDSENAEDGDTETCPSCGRVFVVRDFKKFKSLRFPEEKNPRNDPVISV